MAHTECCELARVSESLKVRRSPDWSLQLDSMKSESLVIAYQNDAVNTFPGLVHSIEGHEAKYQLSTDGDYVVRVYLMRNAARRGETSDYKLTKRF